MAYEDSAEGMYILDETGAVNNGFLNSTMNCLLRMNIGFQGLPRATENVDAFDSRRL